MQKIEEIFGKSIEQIIEEYEFKDLTKLLGPKTLIKIRNEIITFIAEDFFFEINYLKI